MFLHGFSLEVSHIQGGIVHGTLLLESDNSSYTDSSSGFNALLNGQCWLSHRVNLGFKAYYALGDQLVISWSHFWGLYVWYLSKRIFEGGQAKVDVGIYSGT